MRRYSPLCAPVSGGKPNACSREHHWGSRSHPCAADYGTNWLESPFTGHSGQKESKSLQSFLLPFYLSSTQTAELYLSYQKSSLLFCKKMHMLAKEDGTFHLQRAQPSSATLSQASTGEKARSRAKKRVRESTSAQYRIAYSCAELQISASERERGGFRVRR